MVFYVSLHFKSLPESLNDRGTRPGTRGVFPLKLLEVKIVAKKKKTLPGPRVDLIVAQ